MENESTIYLTETAGALSSALVPIVDDNFTVGETQQKLLSEIGTFSTINYIYQVDKNQKLLGVISVRELFASPNEQPLSQYTKKPITVRASDDQEKVVGLALEHNIKALPVVGENGQLLGVVPSDQIMQVLHREHVEDLYRSAGIDHENATSSSVWMQIRSRSPWLVLGAGGGAVAALVVENFTDIFAVELSLIAFIPAIVYIADAVGGQAQLLLIQQMVRTGSSFAIVPYLLRELTVSSLIGLLLSALLLASTWLWLGDLLVVGIISISVFLTVVFSALVAVLMPWLFARLRFDPAVASGPLATVVRDISSLGIYILVAGSFL